MTKRSKLLNSVKKSQRSENADSSTLMEQYKIIREDLSKLKDDLSQGYRMAKEMYEKKSLVKDLMKMK